MNKQLIQHATKRVEFYKDLFHAASNPPAGEVIDQEALSWIVGGLGEARQMVKFLIDYGKKQPKSTYKAKPIKKERELCINCHSFRDSCDCTKTWAEKEANTLKGPKPSFHQLAREGESPVSEDELTDMFGEGGKEEVKEAYSNDGNVESNYLAEHDAN